MFELDPQCEGEAIRTHGSETLTPGERLIPPGAAVTEGGVQARRRSRARAAMRGRQVETDPRRYGAIKSDKERPGLKRSGSGERQAAT